MLAQPGVLTFRTGAADSLAASNGRVVLVTDAATLNPQNGGVALSASYAPLMAPGSMATFFGSRLAAQSAFATSLPLPTEIAGTTVYINGGAVELLYVGSDDPTLLYGQVNFIVPEDLPAGSTEVYVRRSSDGMVTRAVIQVEAVSPGVFTLDATGSGLPIALAVNAGNYSRLWNDDLTPRAVDAGTPEQPTYLVLFGTGWRHRSALSNISVKIDNIEARVEFADAQPDFVALDQMNVVIPPQLAGASRMVDVVITVDGREANRVRFMIQ
jgi:uncharacterized protein (TIGR03437 family)